MTPAMTLWAAAAAIFAAALLPGASARLGVKMNGGILTNVYNHKVTIVYENVHIISLQAGESSTPQDYGYIYYLSAKFPGTDQYVVLNYASGDVTADAHEQCTIESVLPDAPLIMQVNCFKDVDGEFQLKGSGLFCEDSYLQQCSENPPQALGRVVNATAHLAAADAMPIL